ncbi:DUF6538 domain-containing protein [Paraburkholderia sediminicola]|uniref:DUF6538 domain-containing protein n=1 Tax=Paraburkholderia sediminicola TaxID=458836 RepID=UPI0038BA99E0
MSVTLVPHPGGRSRNWYVDISVPASLQDVAGTDRVRRSTRTADRVKALAEGARIEAELRASWLQLSDARQRYETDAEEIILTTDAVKRLAAARLAAWKLTERFEREDSGMDDALLEEVEAFCQFSDREMRSVLAQGQAGSAWENAVNGLLDFVETVGFIVRPDDPLFPELVRQLAKADKTAQAVIALRNQGEDAPFPQPDLPGATLSEMILPYEAHRKGVVDPKTISKSVAIWMRLIKFLGDVALDDVTSGDIYRFMDARLKDPKDGWAQSYVDGHAKRTLREMFALARTQGRMHGENPVGRLETTPKLPKKEQQKHLQPRYPYKAPHLNALFASDWYDPNATHWRGKMSTDLAGRYWCPLISTCHGVRVREVVQLVNSDFSFIDDILLVTVQTDLDEADEDPASLPERKLKNEATFRTVPVHPRLCSLGLADFIRDMQATRPSGTPLFPSAIPNPGGKAPLWGRSYEQAFLRHVRDRLAFGHGFGNHSFRHQHEDRVRDAQLANGAWPAGLGEFLTGRRLPRAVDQGIFREQGSAIDYGDGFMPAHVVRFVEQIGFDGVVFPLPYAQWLARRT